MAINLKKISISTLITVFFISVMSCCCLTEIVQAKEQTPSCHQTAHESEPDQTSDECTCDQHKAFIKDTALLLDYSYKFSPLMIIETPSDFSNLISHVVAFHAPPVVYDPFPIYIKYSIL